MHTAFIQLIWEFIEYSWKAGWTGIGVVLNENIIIGYQDFFSHSSKEIPIYYMEAQKS